MPVFYLPNRTTASKKLLSVCSNDNSSGDCPIHNILRSFDDLKRYLDQNSVSSEVVVLMLDSLAELDRIMSLRGHLLEKRIIAVLPGHEDEIVTAGMSLYPKYISYQDGDFRDVAAVLTKMKV